ncbi:hypothetical protein [uncultured Dokdonia sp.]|uniref:hypothetical protein n=1 Tax=uncultured Dokdonia sp. TaxID=575653 RepID=UPI002631294B|nr:hypothetical protein [uncultured Dokdonia sp.]
MKTFYTPILLIAFTLLITTACQSHKNIQPNVIKTDTLDLGYMYWANDFTPFGFGSRYSLILLGTVTKIENPAEVSEDAIYTSVEGHITIKEVILDSKSHGNDMNSIGSITTDCFEGTTLSNGDQVLVFCVSYEGNYAITGKQSIIKIPKNDKRYITSIKKYINASYDPRIIEKDIELWRKVAVGDALENYLKEYKDYLKEKN